MLGIVELCFDRDVVPAPSIMAAWEVSEWPVNGERHIGPPSGRHGIAPFSVPPGGATVFCSLSGPKIAPSDRQFGALNNARTSVVRNGCFWLSTDSPAMSPVRPLCPNNGPSSADVRFSTDFVRFTPRSRPSWWCRRSSVVDPQRKSIGWLRRKLCSLDCGTWV